MSQKRSAESDLNHDNWADEEEPEQAGTFHTASEEVMKGRTVIKARRKAAGGSSSSEGLFASFKGFANTPPIPSSPGTFDFNKMLNKTAPKSSEKLSSSTIVSTASVNPFASISLLSNKPQTSNPAPTCNSQATGLSSIPSKAPTSNSQATGLLSIHSKAPTSCSVKVPSAAKVEDSVSNQTKRMKCVDDEMNKQEVPSSSNADKSGQSDVSASQKAFEEKVKNLNIKFLHFIHSKVKANPYVILFPPMTDYKKYIEKYMKEKLDSENIEKCKKEGFKFDTLPQGATASVTIQNDKSSERKTFTVGDNVSKTGEGKTNAIGGFSHKTSNEMPKANPTFTFSATLPKETNGPKFDGFYSSEKSTPILSFSSPVKGSALSKGDDKPSGLFEKTDQSNSLSGSNTSKSESSDLQSSKPPAWGFKPAAKSSGFNWGSGGDAKLEKSKATSVTSSQSSFFSSSLSAPSDSDTSTMTAAVKPFSFGFANAPPPAPKEEEDDEPLPKEEVKLIVEDDSVFNIKAKVFVMKPDKSYGERGVGNLFVKPVEEKVKAQVIVRTETDTGKIIFNILVSKNVPIKRDKNNLILVTVPHPTTEKNPSPVTCLIRVKTADDAEKLLDCLEQFRN